MRGFEGTLISAVQQLRGKGPVCPVHLCWGGGGIARQVGPQPLCCPDQACPHLSPREDCGATMQRWPRTPKQSRGAASIHQSQGRAPVTAAPAACPDHPLEQTPCTWK